MRASDKFRPFYEEALGDAADACLQIILGSHDGREQRTREELEDAASLQVSRYIQEVCEGTLGMVLTAHFRPLLEAALSDRKGDWEGDLGQLAEMRWNFSRRVRSLVECALDAMVADGLLSSQSGEIDPGAYSQYFGNAVDDSMPDDVDYFEYY